MKPYYEEKGITIYNGDCREILPQLPKVDLVLTDPPYGIHQIEGIVKQFGKETIYSKDITASIWDKKPSKELLLQVKNFAKYHCIWGGNYFADELGSSKGCFVWDKITGDNTYADGELAWTNLSGTMRIFHHQWCGAFKDSERRMRAMHPTQKPIQLMQWCILSVDNIQHILDPFMGSGTTLRAAKDLGRKAIGIEIEERYCEIAAKRLQQEVLDFSRPLESEYRPTDGAGLFDDGS